MAAVTEAPARTPLATDVAQVPTTAARFKGSTATLCSSRSRPNGGSKLQGFKVQGKMACGEFHVSGILETSKRSNKLDCQGDNQDRFKIVNIRAEVVRSELAIPEKVFAEALDSFV